MVLVVVLVVKLAPKRDLTYPNKKYQLVYFHVPAVNIYPMISVKVYVVFQQPFLVGRVDIAICTHKVMRVIFAEFFTLKNHFATFLLCHVHNMVCKELFGDYSKRVY